MERRTSSSRNWLASLTLLALIAAPSVIGTERVVALEPHHHPRLSGTWRVQITPRVCQSGVALREPFPAMATYHSDGTLSTADSAFSPALRSPGHGNWKGAGGRQYSAVIEAFLFNAGGVWSGIHRLLQTIAVDPNGKTFEATVTSTMLDASGNVLNTGCATSIGTRLE